MHESIAKQLGCLQSPFQTYGKQKRSSAPKVKTGCRNCKAAHVKCNEQLPSCGRCQRRQIHCTYPEVASRERYPAVPGEQSFRVLLGGNRTKPSVHLAEPSSSFMNPREVRYFDTFRRTVIYQLGYGNSEFWSRTVLRESARNDCIRNAVVALGALARAQRQHNEETRCVTGSKKKKVLPMCKSHLTQGTATTIGIGDSSSDHYYQALRHYTKAVGSFRRLVEGLKKTQDSTRTILIATILLVAFESLQGNTQSADQLGAGTLTLLRDTILHGSLKSSKKGKNEKDDEDGKMTAKVTPIAASIDDDGVREAEAVLVRSICLNACLSPTHPKTREIFVQLPVPSSYGPEPPDLSESITVFSRAWASALVLCCLWYMQVQSAMLKAGEDKQRVAEVVDRYLPERPKCIAALAAWQTAVWRRLARATTECEPAENLLVYNKINITLKTTYCSVCTIFDLTGNLWRQYLPTTMQILKQSEALVAQEQEQLQKRAHDNSAIKDETQEANTLRKTDVMHEGVLPVLTQLVREAPEADIRQRAMAALGRMVTSECHWDVQGAYLSTKAHFELQERYRDSVSGHLPVTAQYYALDGEWNDDYSEFQIGFVAKAPGPDGVCRQEVVTMPAVS